MVFDPITNDWVPRFGPGSKKKIEDKYNWALETKAGDNGVDPFTKKRQEKNMQLEKEKLKQLKN